LEFQWEKLNIHISTYHFNSRFLTCKLLSVQFETAKPIDIYVHICYFKRTHFVW